MIRVEVGEKRRWALEFSFSMRLLTNRRFAIPHYIRPATGEGFRYCIGMLGFSIDLMRWDLRDLTYQSTDKRETIFGLTATAYDAFEIRGKRYELIKETT